MKMKNYFLYLVICFSASIFAQDLANKVPVNAPFAMCINSKNLTDKVALKTIQEYPWMQALLEKELKFLPKDLSQTGIDFSSKQYQYYTTRDSVLTYVMLLPLNNPAFFEKLIQSKYGDTIKIKKQGNYNILTTSRNHRLAWNDKFAMFVNASYTKPYKNNYNDTEPYSDLTTMDTTAVLVDSAAAAYVTDEPAYVQEEVKPEPVPEKKQKGKKGKSKKAKKSKKEVEETVIVEPTEEEIYAAQDKANAELEETNRKLLEIENRQNDSIERLKINPVVDLIFKEAFESEKETAVSSSSVFKNNNPKADFFLFADLDILTSQMLGYFARDNATLLNVYKNGLLDSNFYINGYFEKDKIRLSQAITPKSEETKKSYQAMFNSKVDKNLMNYLGENIMAYYSISMDTEAVMNYEYKVFKNTLNTMYQSYYKDAKKGEADVIVDAIAIFLDEKAISDLVPGNAVFVLHDLKKVQRDFVSIDYDENYEQIETKGTKEEIQPNFTFVFGTKNETFLNKLLQLPLNKSKITATDYQLTNGYYTIHLEKDDLLENLYIGIKNGVVMFTTVKENIESLIQQRVMAMNPDFKKSISKNNSAAWLDFQKIITAARTESDNESKSSYYDIASRNAGEITMESKFKNGSLVTESSYTIKGNHTNSLQYLLDLINEYYIESKKETTVTE
jgi:hypothetical protein